MPGGTTCAVAICKSNSKIVKQGGEPIRFFSFPKDPNIRTEWIRKCFRKHEFSVDHARICSKHFKSDDFEDSLQAKLLNFYPKKLNKNAIPSLLLCNSGMVQEDSEDGMEMALKNEIKNESISIDDDESLAEETIKIIFLEDSQEKQNEIVTQLDVPVEVSVEENLQAMIRALQEENTALKNQNINLETKCVNLENKVLQSEQQLNKINSSFEERTKALFKDVLTSNQIDIILKKKIKSSMEQ